jgi:hypothetical protein
MPVEEKRRYAHAEIETSGTASETEAAADALGESLLTLAALPRPRDAVPAQRRLGGLHAVEGQGPRGLDVVGLAEDALEAGGIDLGRLAQRLTPPAQSPWYRAARPEEGAPWPESLAVGLALWAGHAGQDAEWLASAAASLARLTHPGGGEIAGAALAALVARDVSLHGSLDRALARLSEWVPVARRWAGEEPPHRVAQAVEGAAAHPGDVAAARGEAEARGASAELAGGLVGLSAASADWEADPRLASLARRLG